MERRHKLILIPFIIVYCLSILMTGAFAVPDIPHYTISIYPAEKVDWNSGVIDQVWPIGTNIKIYDIGSGVVLWTHRQGGDYHVDVEPLTTNDTLCLCYAYGVDTVQELIDNYSYTYRQCLVTFGTHTYACAMYGIPYGYPEKDTISDNSFDGVFRLYFNNSRDFAGGAVSQRREETIDDAWKNAPNGNKPSEITPVADTSGICGKDATWSLNSDGVLTISGTGDMFSFGFIESPWKNDERIKSVIVHKGITNIGANAFHNCHNLKKVELPDGIIKLENSCFWHCDSLEEINIPSSVKVIEGFAFDCCHSLKSLVLPEGLESISEFLVDECYSLTSINIPESVKSIEQASFGLCRSLKEIHIPNGVQIIRWYTFGCCTGLTEVVIPDGLKTIECMAFQDCTNLRSVSIPKSLTFIEEMAFTRCDSLTDVYFRGTKKEAEKLEIESNYNDSLLNAVWHYWPDQMYSNPISGKTPFWTLGSTGVLEFIVKHLMDDDNIMSHFSKALIDNQLLDAKYYSLRKGSLIIGIKDTFLNTLKPGRHTVTLVFDDGSIDLPFNIEAAPVIPKTGDQSILILWIIMVLCGLTSLGCIIYRRKRFTRK